MKMYIKDNYGRHWNVTAAIENAVLIISMIIFIVASSCLAGYWG